MEQCFGLQIAALRKLVEYSRVLIPSTKDVISELRNGRKDDTTELLNLVITGINWEVDIFDLTLDVLKSKELLRRKSEIESGFVNMSRSLANENDVETANYLESAFLPFLVKLETSAMRTIQAVTSPGNM